MNFFASISAVESARHKVCSAAFFVQAAFFHVDAGVSGHQVVGILQPSKPLWISQFPIAVIADAIKLQQPVFKTLGAGQLAGPKLTGSAIPE